MPRTEKLYLQQQAIRNEAEKALETASTAKPKRYYELQNAKWKSWVACNELASQRHHLACAQTTASMLEENLQRAGLHAEASIVVGLSTIIERRFQEVYPPLNNAVMEADKKYKEAMEAIDREFPDE